MSEQAGHTPQSINAEPPFQCPLCAADLRCSTPESETEFAEWEYECNAIIHRDENGKLFCFSNCPEAMREALDLINYNAKRAAKAQGQSPSPERTET